MSYQISRFGACIFGLTIIPILAIIILVILIFEKTEKYKTILLEDRENE